MLLVKTESFQLSVASVLPTYQRRRPEETILYKTIAENLETFLVTIDRDPQRKGLPEYVRNEFYEFLKCGILAHGFLRARCEKCHHEKLVAFSCKRRGFCPSCGGHRMADTAAYLVEKIFPKVRVRQWVLSFPLPLRYLMASTPKVQSKVLAITIRAISGMIRKKVRAQGLGSHVETGALTLIQRFGSSINLNPHFHVLGLEGAYLTEESKPRFVPVQPPTDEQIIELLSTLSTRILRMLIRNKYFEQEALIQDPLADQEPVLACCMAASVKYQIALGPRAGQKVRHIRNMKECFHQCFYEEATLTGPRCAALGGFSLHANTSCELWEREKLEQLCRYVARPAIALYPLGNLSTWERLI